MRNFPLVLLAALLFAAGCGENGTQREPTRQQEQTPSPQQDTTAAAAPQPRQPRSVLETLQARADKTFRNAPEDDPLERLAMLQYANAQQLMIIARTLDAQGVNTPPIEEYSKRFAPDAGAALGVRLTNSMMGIYTAYTLLYTMRFQHTPERLEHLPRWKNEIDRLIAKNDLMINPMSKMSDYSYIMLKDILRDIDQENRLESMFKRSDSLYAEGNTAAGSGEDRYLNAAYRLFELSQVWALQLDVDASPKVNQIKSAFRNKLLSAQTIGEQMAAALEYEYYLLRLVATLTMDSMYQQPGK